MILLLAVFILQEAPKPLPTIDVADPDWKDQLLSYQTVDKNGRNLSGTLVMQNLRRQLETLKCD